MVLSPRDHSMCLASPEKAHATVRTLPGSMLISSGKASILGAEPGKGQILDCNVTGTIQSKEPMFCWVLLKAGEPLKPTDGPE